MYRHCQFICIVAVAALLQAGCSSNEPPPTFRTGWLGPLNHMERIEGTGDTGVFVRRTEKPASIDSIFIESVEIVVAAGSDLATINPDDIEAMRQLFEDDIRQALSDRFTVAAERSPGTYLFRAALTNIAVGKTGRFSGVTPRANLLFRFNNVRVQAELRDGATNMRRAVSIIAPDTQTVNEPATESWEAIPPRLNVMADRLATQFEVARGALAQPLKPETPKKN